MRRVDRQRDDESFINQVLDDAETIYLAMFDGEYPYCIPLNFCRLDRKLYMHCALEGHKSDLITQNPHVAFATALDIEIDREKATTYFRSVSGRGIARIIGDVSEKCRALEILADKYDSKCPRPCPPRVADRVIIIGIEIEDIHGKQSIRAEK